MKAHSLYRLTQKVMSTPQMMEATAFTDAAVFLDSRNEHGISLYLNNEAKEYNREIIYNADTATGVIKLTGPLTYLHYQPMCAEAPTSYQGMLADFESMVEMGAKVIVFDTDSPGGEAYQAFETARRMRTLADQHGIKLITYVDGIAASAAYAIASVSDEIIVNPNAEVGSIGVVMRLRNMNKAMQSMGVEDTYIYAGDSKIPFDGEGNFQASFISDLQEKVNALYGEFTSHVATMRNIDVMAVANTQAKMFMPDKALQLGLADKVMEVEEFYEYLAIIADGENDTTMLNRFNMKKENEMTELSTLQATFEAYKVDAEASLADTVALLTAQKEEAASLLSQLEAAKLAIAGFEAEQETAALAAVEAAKLDKETQRKAALSAVVAEDEVPVMLASLEALSDEAFASVVGAMGKKAKALESSDLFKELGVADQGDADVLSETAKVLAQKYTKNTIS